MDTLQLGILVMTKFNADDINYQTCTW